MARELKQKVEKKPVATPKVARAKPAVAKAPAGPRKQPDDGAGFVLYKPVESNKAKATWEFLCKEDLLPLFIPQEVGKKGEFKYYSFTYNGIGISIAKGVYVNVARSLALHLQECFQQTASVSAELKVSGSEHGDKFARLDLQDESSRGVLNA